MPLSREERVMMNSKEQAVSSGDVKGTLSHSPSSRNMSDGEQVYARESNKPLALYKKFKGVLWKSYFSKDGNQVIDKTLSANTLKYTNRFIDYRSFSHNFADDLDANEHFLPWWNNDELTSLRPPVGYLAPFNMTCHKLIFKPPDLDDNADNILFTIKKMDDGDATIDSLCTYTYSTTFVDNTSITINRSDWSANPSVESGDVIGISITASDAGIVTGAKDFYITSVWRVEVVI